MTDETNIAANDQTVSTGEAPQTAGGTLGGIENQLEAAVGDVKEFFGGHPTPTEARAMFVENPSLTYVVTSEGGLHRNGTLEPIAAE